MAIIIIGPDTPKQWAHGPRAMGPQKRAQGPWAQGPCAHGPIGPPPALVLAYTGNMVMRFWNSLIGHSLLSIGSNGHFSFVFSSACVQGAFLEKSKKVSKNTKSQKN